MARTPFLVIAAFATALMAHGDRLPEFDDYDTDADGLITEAEFVSRKTGGDRSVEAEAVAKFAKFDVDGNYTVSEEEFNMALEAWRGRLIPASDDTSGLTN